MKKNAISTAKTSIHTRKAVTACLTLIATLAIYHFFEKKWRKKLSPKLLIVRAEKSGNFSAPLVNSVARSLLSIALGLCRFAQAIDNSLSAQIPNAVRLERDITYFINFQFVAFNDVHLPAQFILNLSQDHQACLNNVMFLAMRKPLVISSAHKIAN